MGQGHMHTREAQVGGAESGNAWPTPAFAPVHMLLASSLCQLFNLSKGRSCLQSDENTYYCEYDIEGRLDAGAIEAEVLNTIAYVLLNLC